MNRDDALALAIAGLEIPYKDFTSVDRVQFTYGHAAGRNFVYFQSTNSCEDWMDDFKTCMQEIPEASKLKVHLGFWTQWMMVQNHPDVVNADCYVGHSLGAALATLAAWRYRREAVCLGSPRVGNGAFASLMGTSIIRITHRNDIVPHLPPVWLGYRHAGPEIKIQHSPRPWWSYFVSDLKAHWPVEYLKALRAQ
jgi:predicted lipase